MLNLLNSEHDTLTQEIVALAEQLMACPSVSPNDAGCQHIIRDFLTPLGFQIETMQFEDTTNLWATRGQGESVFCFAGHTDVVPPGDLSQWQTDPFQPTHKAGYLYGRGAADMKGSLAAMLIATKHFVSQHPNHQDILSFLITSDEEGDYVNGTVKVIDTLKKRGERLTWAVVGEPTSSDQLGDVIKIGRRGSLTGHLTIFGTQGHVAYPHLANNPIHLAAPALAELVQTTWDHGNRFFPATSLQIVNLQSGSGATNVIPSQCVASFNFRYASEVTHEQLQQRVAAILDQHQLQYDLKWHLSGAPFLTSSGKLLEATTAAVQTVTGHRPRLETTGGTSDGRFIAPTGAEVIELGPVNATIHQVNERVAVKDLTQLALCYQKILERLLIC
ncbi:MAG: succinyl-diaminopimelate desuccinylase [Shewanellaceae bacterium]|nr:succinyl-diaminopimelate desuccinylase [Shewanellaceae bacterium]